MPLGLNEVSETGNVAGTSLPEKYELPEVEWDDGGGPAGSATVSLATPCNEAIRGESGNDGSNSPSGFLGRKGFNPDIAVKTEGTDHENRGRLRGRGG